MDEIDLSGLPELLTVQEVARILRCSKMSIYRQIHSGQLDAVKITTRAYRVRRDALEARLNPPRRAAPPAAE